MHTAHVETATDRARRAEALIPWGTQTNAKRHNPAMGASMPHFIERAEGCRIQDIDGKWYIDYRSSLGPIILGYNHPKVQQAVIDQLQKGALFSMASPIELDLAEQLVRIIPGLDQVRYLKSGNEVNHVAIRLARAYTRRDVILTCGYHGHGDWFSCGAGSAIGWAWPREGNGVPVAMDDLIIKIPYGDIKALEHAFAIRGDEIAGMMTVPYDWNETVGHDFIQRARELTSEHDAALIYDQILTGFRLGLEGAQGYFGVIPDLTTYGKAIANGHPLAVVGGKSEFMSMFDRVMITTTHAGDTLSIAAGLATLGVMESEPVFEHIWEMGKTLMEGFDTLARSHGLEARSFGLPPAPQFRFSEDNALNTQRQTGFFRTLFDSGVFPNTQFLINYAHKEQDIEETLEVMDHALGRLEG